MVLRALRERCSRVFVARAAGMLFAALPCLLRPALAAAQVPDDDVVTGLLGVEAGYVSPRHGPAVRDGLGPGLALGVSGAFLIADQLLIGAGAVFVGEADHRSFSQAVVSCDGYGENCSNDSTSASSSVGGGLFRFEAGYQHRFALSRVLSLVPGVWAGYAWSLGPMTRSIAACVDCAGEELPFDTSGAYVAPFLRLSLAQRLALSVRSQWFLSGDLQQMTLVAFEIGRP